MEFYLAPKMGEVRERSDLLGPIFHSGANLALSYSLCVFFLD